MEIKRSILHILDGNSGNLMLSEGLMDLSNVTFKRYIKGMVDKASSNIKGSDSVFREDSWLKKEIKTMDFIELSQKVAREYFEDLIQSEKPSIMDFFMVNYIDEEEDYIALIFINCKMGYNNVVENRNMALCNEISYRGDILPKIPQRADSFALINLGTLRINFSERESMVNGRPTYILPEKILMCEEGFSQKEVFEEVKSIMVELGEDEDIDRFKMSSMVKNYMRETTTSNRRKEESIDEMEEDGEVTEEDVKPLTKKIPIEEFIERVLEGKEALKEKVMEKTTEKNIPLDLKVDKSIFKREGKSHKLKTDKGIVITVPSELFDDKSSLEIIKKEDGRSEILIKNIGDIINE